MSLSDRFGRDDDDDWKDETPELAEEGTIEVPDERPKLDVFQWKDNYGQEYFQLERPLQTKTYLRTKIENAVEVRQ